MTHWRWLRKARGYGSRVAINFGHDWLLTSAVLIVQGCRVGSPSPVCTLHRLLTLLTGDLALNRWVQCMTPS